MTDKLERLWKEAVTANQGITWHLSEGLRKTMTNIIQDNWCLAEVRNEHLLNVSQEYWCYINPFGKGCAT